MKHDIASANNLTRGQESAVLLKIAEQSGIPNVEEAVTAFLKGLFEIVKFKLLELVSTVVIPATKDKFVAKDKFVVNTEHNAPVKISKVWSNFTVWFLNDDGKTEDPISEQTLHYHKLWQSSVDGHIIAELGGAEKSETTLSEMFALMEKQSKGEDGVLLNNNAYANIFYIKDQNGVLRTVSVCWHVDGWYVRAHSVEGAWDDGDQVFSRNSVLESSETSVPAQA